MAAGVIALRGVEVHNLKEVDLDIPRGKLIVLCGLSGSGKTSLALDTLYAEGQRRYIDSFSPYTRQFLERLEKPAADRIDGMPPAIAVTHKNTSRSNRSTVGTATETSDYLRLLLARIGQLFCLDCGGLVRRQTPQTAADELARLPAAARLLVAFEAPPVNGDGLPGLIESLRSQGFIRLVVEGRSVNLTDPAAAATLPATTDQPVLVVVDRLTAGGNAARLRDSLETAFAKGESVCQALVEESAGADDLSAAKTIQIDGQPWRQLVFSGRMRCESCGREYPEIEPRLLSFNSPLGACPNCEGFGNISTLDTDVIVPDPTKTLADGAIAPWNTSGYAHEREELRARRPLRAAAARRAVSRSDRRAEADPGRGLAETPLRRPGRLFRASGTPQIQNARAGVLEPLAELSALSRLPRSATAPRGFGRADRRKKPGRNLGPQDRGRPAVFDRARADRLAAARRPADARAGDQSARLSGRSRAGLSFA